MLQNHRCMHIPAYSWDSHAPISWHPIWMLKETLQGPSESSGSNYHHKEIFIYQASNHWLLTTLIIILFADKILTQLFPLCFLRSEFATYGYIFFHSRGSPRKFPGLSNEWLFVACLCHCCVSHLFLLFECNMDLALGAKQAIHIAPIAIQANACNIFIESMYQASFLSII